MAPLQLLLSCILDIPAIPRGALFQTVGAHSFLGTMTDAQTREVPRSAALSLCLASAMFRRPQVVLDISV